MYKCELCECKLGDGWCTTCAAEANAAGEEAREAERYPYRHHGPAVHGSKLEDYLITVVRMKEDGLLPPDADV